MPESLCCCCMSATATHVLVQVSYTTHHAGTPNYLLSFRYKTLFSFDCMCPDRPCDYFVSVQTMTITIIATLDMADNATEASQPFGGWGVKLRATDRTAVNWVNYAFGSLSNPTIEVKNFNSTVTAAGMHTALITVPVRICEDQLTSVPAVSSGTLVHIACHPYSAH